MAEAKRKPEAAGFFLGLIQATSPLAPLRWCKNRDENLPGLPTFPLSSLGQRSEGGWHLLPCLPPMSLCCSSGTSRHLILSL